jgi:hypothetical protein
MKYVFYGILIYIAYQFIFKLVIPLYRATRKIKKGFREMNERMQAQQNPEGQAGNFEADTSKKPFKPRSEDYIEYEEVK